MKTPIKELTSYRRDIGKTLDALAGELKINKSTLSRWESGDVLIPVGRLAELEALTGISRQKLRPDIFVEAAE